MKNKSTPDVSILRTQKHTQSLIRDPVLLTMFYSIKEVALLIQLALDQGIRLCTRIDIKTPNGLQTSEDFALSSEQIRQVWQVRPSSIELTFTVPPDWPCDLQSPVLSKVGIDGLLIDKVEAEAYLCTLAGTTSSNIQQKKLTLKLDPNRPSNLGRDKSAILCHALEEIIIEARITTVNRDTLWTALISGTNEPNSPFKKSKKNIEEKETSKTWDRATATHHLNKVIEWWTNHQAT